MNKQKEFRKEVLEDKKNLTKTIKSPKIKKLMSSDGYMVEHFKKDESKGIKEYKGAIKKSKGREKETYKKILSDEKKHLKALKKI